MDEILLVTDGGWWHAAFRGAIGRESDRVLGTRIAPTAYRSCTPVEQVIAALERRNPGVLVRESPYR